MGEDKELAVRRFYLDQWVWIRLARAAHGHPDSARYLAALELARVGAEHRWVSFPLGPAHYIELAAGANAVQRRAVGGLMYELSYGNRMIGPNRRLLAAELDAALMKYIELAPPPRKVRVFGHGVSHAFSLVPDVSSNVEKMLEPHAAVLSQEDRERLARLATEALERASLEGVIGVDVPEEFRELHQATCRKFVESEVAQAQRIQEHGLPRERWPDALLAREWVDLLQVLDAEVRELGLSADWFVAQGQEFLTSFLRDLPTAFVCLEMRRLQHENPQRAWRASDEVDVHALAVALVYCDVLVTEKHWAHLIRRAGLDERYETVVLDRVDDLVDHLVLAA